MYCAHHWWLKLNTGVPMSDGYYMDIVAMYVMYTYVYDTMYRNCRKPLSYEYLLKKLLTRIY